MPGDPVLEVAAWGLRPIDTVRLDAATVSAIAEHRITGVAMAAWRAGFIETDDDVIELLREAHRQAVESSMAAMAAGGRAVDTLRAAGIEPVVLKGWATAHLDHADPVERTFGDADLLVGGRIVDAIDALAAGGATWTMPPPSRRWLARFGKDIAMVVAGYEVDLHRSLVEGAFGLTIDVDELLSCTEPFSAGTRSLLALDAPGRLLHAAIHTASSAIGRLSSSRDVGQLALLSEADWPTAVERAVRWRCDALLAAGVSTTWHDLRLPPHPVVDWAAGHQPAADQVSAMRALRGGEARWWSGLPVVPWRDRPAYLWPLVFPSAEFLAARGRTRFSHVTSSLARLRP